jgi:phosphatidylserine/phosphatidylglycerophosphate/cardiolipin synthase-like enzyme
LDALLPPYARREGPAQARSAAPDTAQVRVLTEGKIRKGLLDCLASTGPGDRIDVGMFYLSERRIIQGLLRAAARGAVIRVLLDPNRDAFGYEKSGIPNRPVAAELVERSGGKIQVRWANTRGEQFHSKLVLVRQGGQATVLTGSANLTRRNIADYNLETDLVVTGPAELKVFAAAADYFERLWSNRDLEGSVPGEAFGASRIQQWQGWIQERTGLGSF